MSSPSKAEENSTAPDGASSLQEQEEIEYLRAEIRRCYVKIANQKAFVEQWESQYQEMKNDCDGLKGLIEQLKYVKEAAAEDEEKLVQYTRDYVPLLQGFMGYHARHFLMDKCRHLHNTATATKAEEFNADGEAASATGDVDEHTSAPNDKPENGSQNEHLEMGEGTDLIENPPISEVSSY